MSKDEVSYRLCFRFEPLPQVLVENFLSKIRCRHQQLLFRHTTGGFENASDIISIQRDLGCELSYVAVRGFFHSRNAENTCIENDDVRREFYCIGHCLAL